MKLYQVRIPIGVLTTNTKVWARSHEEAYNQAVLERGFKESQIKEAIIWPLSQ